MGLTKEFEKWINKFINHPEEVYKQGITEEVYNKDVIEEIKKMFVMYRLQGLNENIAYFPEKELNEVFPVNLPHPYNRSSKLLQYSADGSQYSDISVDGSYYPDSTGDTNIYIEKTVSKDLIKCIVKTPINLSKEIIWLATFIRVKWNKEWDHNVWRTITKEYMKWNAGLTGVTGYVGPTGVIGHTGYCHNSTKANPVTFSSGNASFKGFGP